MKTMLSLALGAALMMGAGTSEAADLDYLSEGGNSCFNTSAAFSPIGQTFTIPVGETTLETVSLRVYGSGSGILGLRTISGNVLGPNLESVAWSQTGDANQTLILAGNGRAVTPGDTYAVVLETTTLVAAISCSGDFYADGAVYQTNGGGLQPWADTPFAATFGAPPAAVPTLSEWAMILLGTILAGGAALVIQRRQGFGEA